MLGGSPTRQSPTTSIELAMIWPHFGLLVFSISPPLLSSSILDGFPCADAYPTKTIVFGFFHNLTRARLVCSPLARHRAIALFTPRRNLDIWEHFTESFVRLPLISLCPPEYHRHLVIFLLRLAGGSRDDCANAVKSLLVSLYFKSPPSVPLLYAFWRPRHLFDIGFSSGLISLLLRVR